MVKVPHHGSPGADDAEMWDRLLIDENLAVVAPWRRGGSWRPTIDDIDRLAVRSPTLWITTEPWPEGDASSINVPDAAPPKAPAVGYVTLRTKLRGACEWQVYSAESAFQPVPS